MNTKQMLVLTVLLTCTFILARGAPLDTSAFTFKMPVGTALSTQSDDGSLFWASVGPAGPGITIGAGSLSFAGLQSSLGNRARVVAPSAGARIAFPNPITSNTLFVSAMLRITDLTGLATEGAPVLGFWDYDWWWCFRPAAGGRYQIDVSKSNSFRLTGDYIIGIAETVFVVASYTFVPGADNDIVRLWVNPLSTSFGAAVPPETAVTTSDGPDAIELPGVQIHAATSPGSPAGYEIDEIRVGPTWASVTPPAAALVGYSSGSTGAYGPLNVTSNTTFDLPADGIIHATDVSIASNAVLRFNRNANNTPVSLLARGRVVINGIINVSGEGGNAVRGGQGGPGGYDGGFPQSGGSLPGEGYGLGRARLGSGGGGAAAHRTGPNTVDINGYSPVASGQPYGSVLQNPVEGGSGGSGIDVGGGGGGGAILIASDAEVAIGTTGAINANGAGAAVNRSNPGSGGGVRIVAPKVSGTGSINVSGGDVYFGSSLRGRGGDGYVRIDTLNRSELSINAPGASIGSSMNVSYDKLEDLRLRIAEVAGTIIPEGSGPVTIVRPIGSNSNITVKVIANGFNALVPVRLCALPDSGTGAGYSATLNNTAGPAEHVFNLAVPVNVRVTLNAFGGKDVPPAP